MSIVIIKGTPNIKRTTFILGSKVFVGPDIPSLRLAIWLKQKIKKKIQKRKCFLSFHLARKVAKLPVAPMLYIVPSMWTANRQSNFDNASYNVQGNAAGEHICNFMILFNLLPIATYPLIISLIKIIIIGANLYT